MCGFRVPSVIAKFLETVPELRATVGAQVATEFEAAASGPAVRLGATRIECSGLQREGGKAQVSPLKFLVMSHASQDGHKPALKALFGALMKADATAVAAEVNKLEKRLKEKHEAELEEVMAVLRAAAHFSTRVAVSRLKAVSRLNLPHLLLPFPGGELFFAPGLAISRYVGRHCLSVRRCLSDAVCLTLSV